MSAAWWLQLIGFILAVLSSICAVIGFLLSPQDNIYKSFKNFINQQTHYGNGDNIAGDKNIFINNVQQISDAFQIEIKFNLQNSRTILINHGVSTVYAYGYYLYNGEKHFFTNPYPIYAGGQTEIDLTTLEFIEEKVEKDGLYSWDIDLFLKDSFDTKYVAYYSLDVGVKNQKITNVIFKSRGLPKEFDWMQFPVNLKAEEGTISFWTKSNFQFNDNQKEILFSENLQRGSVSLIKETDNKIKGLYKIFDRGEANLEYDVSKIDSSQKHNFIFTWNLKNKEINLYIDGEKIATGEIII